MQIRSPTRTEIYLFENLLTLFSKLKREKKISFSSQVRFIPVENKQQCD